MIKVRGISRGHGINLSAGQDFLTACINLVKLWKI
jgi:hypothetical protein